MTAIKIPQLYKGSDTCDLVMDWECAENDYELRGMLDACHAANPDDLTPQLVLADLLGERADDREQWVRFACDVWGKSATLKSSSDACSYDQVKAELSLLCKTELGWRLAGLYGSLLSHHCPSGYGVPMSATWTDIRVNVANRWCYWWSLRLAKSSQASAAGIQAYVAWKQAYVAWNQAYAAGNQAYAAGNQAYAAWNQAYAAGQQADAAREQAYSFAIGLWELILSEAKSGGML